MYRDNQLEGINLLDGSIKLNGVIFSIILRGKLLVFVPIKQLLYLMLKNLILSIKLPEKKFRFKNYFVSNGIQLAKFYMWVEYTPKLLDLILKVK